jgi:hypothetical protein
VSSGISDLCLTSNPQPEVIAGGARWVLVDLVGKGKRIRTVPMPAWPSSRSTSGSPGRD